MALSFFNEGGHAFGLILGRAKTIEETPLEQNGLMQHRLEGGVHHLLFAIAASGGIRQGYVRIPAGQVHFRAIGEGPPVILLSYSFLSSAMHIPLMQQLADRFTLIALDTPGYGASDPLLLGRQAEIDDFGDILADTIDALGCTGPVLFQPYQRKNRVIMRLPASGQSRIFNLRRLGRTGRLVARNLYRTLHEAVRHHRRQELYRRNWTIMRDFRRFVTRRCRPYVCLAHRRYIWRARAMCWRIFSTGSSRTCRPGVATGA